MGNPDAYISLVTSLPNPERLFRTKQPPLSRIRLERKLTALEESDREILDAMEHLLSWSSYEMKDEDRLSIKRAKRVVQLSESKTLRSIVSQRMDLRAVIAALRLRRDGKELPSYPWAPTPLLRHIAQNWSDPTFKLDNRMRWLREAVQIISHSDPLAMERHILDVTYRQLQAHGARHHFDFEAVVIYVLKWNIFDRWAKSDDRAASRRFGQLTQDALGSFDARALQEFA